MQNSEIADAFAELAARLALTDEKPFRYLAYRKADEAIRSYPHSIAHLSSSGRLREVDGIGPAIEEKIGQLIEHGTFPALERAREQVDDTLLALTRLPGIGPATARKVHAALAGETFESAVQRAAAGDIAIAAPFTKKVVAALAAEHARLLAGPGAAPASAALSGVPRDRAGVALDGPWFRRDQVIRQHEVIELLVHDAATSAGMPHPTVELLGEYARGCELVSGIDVLVGAAQSDAQRLQAAVAELLDEHAYSVVGIAGEPLAIVTPSGIPASITITEATPQARSLVAGPASWHEHGVAAEFDAVPYELRDAVLDGDMELAAATAADLVHIDDLRGELHGHSDWSDGTATILEMAHAARSRGDSYYLVSDHSAPYAMVGGLTEERLLAQAGEIQRVNEQLLREQETDGQPAFRVLHGSEVEILADGTLGLPDSALAILDWVVASIHVAQGQDAESMLRRMQRVLANPLVDAIGHPTSRRLLVRERTALDVDELIDLAVAAGVVLEINANPDRLDLDSSHARRAGAAGARLAINCDAHRPSNLDHRRHGVAVARRAGLSAAHIVNTIDAPQLLARRRRDE